MARDRWEYEPLSYWTDRKVLVTGANGFLGKHVVAVLQEKKAKFRALEGRKDCDLRDPWDTSKEFEAYKPDIVIHLAAVVGGIGANRVRPADFFIDNTMMGASILSASRAHRIEKLVMVGTTCAYPKFCKVPFKESDIWSGYPEETNAPYGIAKRALMVGAQALRAQYGIKVANLIPTNLYGPGDNFHPQTSHVIPAIMSKMYKAKGIVELWGTGKPTRDFLYVKDAAEAIVKAAEVSEDGYPINLGSGIQISIGDLAERIAKVVGFGGGIIWDSSKPDGQPKRALDTSSAYAALKWKATTSFSSGLIETFEYFKRTLGNV